MASGEVVRSKKSNEIQNKVRFPKSDTLEDGIHLRYKSQLSGFLRYVWRFRYIYISKSSWSRSIKNQELSCYRFHTATFQGAPFRILLALAVVEAADSIAMMKAAGQTKQMRDQTESNLWLSHGWRGFLVKARNSLSLSEWLHAVHSLSAVGRSELKLIVMWLTLMGKYRTAAMSVDRSATRVSDCQALQHLGLFWRQARQTIEASLIYGNCGASSDLLRLITLDPSWARITCWDLRLNKAGH